MAVLVIVVVAALVILSRQQTPTAYNSAKEATVTGTIKEVQEFYCPVTDDRGTHLLLTTDKGDVLVHVALTRFLRKQNIAFGVGDKVDVLGSMVKEDAMIARQVTRAGEIYIFRDAAGTPMWQ
jgi:hypothetical protein